MSYFTLFIELRRKQCLDDWRVLFPDFQMPPLEFYALLEAAIRERQVPDLEVEHREYKESNLLSDKRVYLRLRRDRLRFDCCAAPFGSGYLVSYWLWRLPAPFTLFHFLGLLITFGLLLPALLLLPAGHGAGLSALAAALLALFIALRLRIFRRRGQVEEFLLGMSVIGVIWELFFHLPGYFEKDTAAAFHTVVHDSTMAILDGLAQTHGLRVLKKKERRKVLMRDFYK